MFACRILRIIIQIIALLSLFLTFTSSAIAQNARIDLLISEQQQYVCHRCPHVDDIHNTKVYDHDGQCPICQMNLIELHSPALSKILELHTGSGNFYLPGGQGKQDELLHIFYHLPKAYNSETKVLLVIPGAGRNAWHYRDLWVTASEKHNVLILSPSYPEKIYDFAGYNLGNIITDLEFANPQALIDGEKTGQYRFQDDELKFKVNHQQNTWIYDDFDHIFNRVIAAINGTQTSYDIFGHSAGGQILHRLAIFHPDSKVNRIIAANSGSYTLPNFEYALPFGLSDSNITNAQLSKSFAQKLTLLIGELDNEQETRGSLLHTPTLDQQGLGRLSRSQFFFAKSAAYAKTINAEFNWQHQIVKGVGHDAKPMSAAAAKYLYEQ